MSPTGRLEKERETVVEELDWHELMRDFQYKPGNHVTILGPTECGKTTLAMHLLNLRPYDVMFSSKPKDPLFDELIRRGWTRIDRWPKATYDDDNGRRRLLLWIPTARKDQVKKTAAIFQDALEKIMAEGSWTVDIDELLFAAHPRWLALGDQFELMWQQARTLKVSLQVKSQRSAYIPQLAYDQVEHLFVFRENDKRNADRIGEMAALDRFEVRDVVRDLGRHEVLYIGVRNGRLVRTQCPKII